MVAALVSITLLTYPRFYPLRPACFPRYFLNLCYDWSLCLAPSLPLMVWLRCRFVQAAIALFIRFSLPSCNHSFRHHSPALHPVFQQLVPTAGNLLLHPSALVVLRYAPLMVFCGRWRTRTACSSEALRGITECATVYENIPLIPFAGLHLYSGFSFLVFFVSFSAL